MYYGALHNGRILYHPNVADGATNQRTSDQQQQTRLNAPESGYEYG